MKIVTTPMCEEIVKLAGVKEYKVNKFPTREDGDLAILLSESKTDLDSISVKLNTFKQIVDAVEKVAKHCKTTPKIDFKDNPLAIKYLEKTPKNTTRLKVYSNFLKDIVLDMGFKIVDEGYDYIVAPDYLVLEVKENDVEIIEIPSHGNVSHNPIVRASQRYEILEDYINK